MNGHQTQRLKFRCLTENDLEPLMAFFNDPIATRFVRPGGDVGRFAKEWLARQMRRYDNGPFGLHALELLETGELIGQAGATMHFVDHIPKLEIGYHLIRQFWGNGYATEAARACRDFCFENEMAETLISLIDPDNLASIQVAKKNNMTYWKTADFHNHPHSVYRVRRWEWEASWEP